MKNSVDIAFSGMESEGFLFVSLGLLSKTTSNYVWIRYTSVWIEEWIFVLYFCFVKISIKVYS